jgi:ATP-binding protein involved in chromosome partitioning
MAITREDVLAALSRITDPATGRSVVESSLIQGVVVRDGNVGFAVEVPAARGRTAEPLRKACEDAVTALPGVLSVTAVLTAQTESAPARHAPHPAPQTIGIEGVSSVIAVASGKGGVGKSTVAVNLALGLSKLGLKVGLLDADIYGPSVPRLLDIKEKPNSDGKKLQPIERYGIKAMSMGFLVKEDEPMIWRGPMVQSAITQMLNDVAWAPIDVLVVDMPPGTGDAQLTMAQRVPLKGAVIVSTPQDIALIDARRGLTMFQKVDVPVLGIIENMSYFLCPHCGERSDIFSHGGARREAERLGCEFLGEVPLDLQIRETSDEGRPVTVSDPGSAHARLFREIAARVWAKVSGEESMRRAPPRIVVE